MNFILQVSFALEMSQEFVQRKKNFSYEASLINRVSNFYFLSTLSSTTAHNFHN